VAFDNFRGFDFSGRRLCGSPSDAAPVKPIPAGRHDRGRRALLLSFAALVGLSIGLTEALAHSRLVKSEPAARAVVTAPLAEVKLWFNESIEPAFAKVWIISGDGSQTPLTTRGDASDPRLVVVTLPASLPEGPVNIGYHVLSVDGHVVESQLSFTIQKPA
jgi:methionine-rich copper-binding protein CopC